MDYAAYNEWARLGRNHIYKQAFEEVNKQLGRVRKSKNSKCTEGDANYITKCITESFKKLLSLGYQQSLVPSAETYLFADENKHEFSHSIKASGIYDIFIDILNKASYDDIAKKPDRRC